MLTFIIFILVLSVLVLVHEFGHFWTAKKMGMAVDEFGIGFPPRAWSIKYKGTTYSINWLPLGGFVKIKGEDGEFRSDPDSFVSKKPWQRFIVLAAGVVMNFLLAVVLLSVGFMVGLPQSVEGIKDAQVTDRKLQVIEVLKDSPAQIADLKIGDDLKSLNGTPLSTVADLTERALPLLDQTATLEILRDGQTLTKEVDVKVLKETGKPGIGVGLMATGIVKYGPFRAVWEGLLATIHLTGQMVVGFYEIIKNIVIGKGPGMEVSGPIGIAVMTGEVARLGFAYLIQFTALLSINLAVINFLPFPALDGGRAIFVILEQIRRKPVKQKVEAIFHAAGFALLMLLVVIVTFKDIVRLIK